MTTGKKIALFDSQLKLIAIVNGISQLSKMISKDTGSILRAITGERIACGNYYPRFIPDDTIIDMDDLGALDLIEFDNENGNGDRLIYVNRNMKRSGIIKESDYEAIRDSKYKLYKYSNKGKK